MVTTSKKFLFMLCTKLYLHTITGTRQSFPMLKGKTSVDEEEEKV